MKNHMVVVMAALALAPSASLARLDVGEIEDLKLVTARMAEELRSRTRRLAASAGSEDTTYVGYTPGAPGAGTTNYWSIWAGHGKDGYHRPRAGSPGKGMWDWEEPVNGDSLQGWWPIRNPYTSTGGYVFSDRNRPWWAIDIGNTANYRINQAIGRTFGVIGVWHVDGGSTVAPPGPFMPPAWAPFSGGAAAWMGLRAHGDLSYLDPITGNPFNESVLMFSANQSADADGSDSGFPGYGSQMDQMLYRDISLEGHDDEDLTVSFAYRTEMSTGFNTNTSTRTGWFDGDPLGVTAGGPALPAGQRNNFISSSDAGDCCAPRDSFMVYVGAGVEPPQQWLGSDGALRDVYDPQRRWFAEVLHWDRDPESDPARPQPLYYRELLSVAGSSGGWQSRSFTIPNAALQPFLGKSGRVRLVFRVKTNRGFDDQGNAYSSIRLGAAVVDDVRIRIGSGPEVVLGAFDDLSEILNHPNVSALNAWKSTGKPPAIYQHVHPLADLLYEDICGQPGAITRFCDLNGVVVSGGDHDHDEEAGGAEGTADRETLDGMVSPTIVFADDDGDPETRNVHGLYGAGGNGGRGDIIATEDYYLDYEMYAGVMDPFSKGVMWQPGVQSYPARGDASHGLYPTWGNLITPGAIFFNPDQECFRDLEPAYSFGLLRTSNPSGIPDSIRLFLRKWVTCFRFNVTTGCRSTDGVYWDNVSLTLIDGDYPQVAVDPWDWWNDAFPANEDSSLLAGKASFDTTSALIKSGRNIAQTTGNVNRPAVPGDTVVVRTPGTSARVDLVFRVLPGPGNYEPIGDGLSGTIRRLPTSPATVTPNDGSWWDVYRRIPGEFASPGAAALLASAPSGWDPNVWLSARCDTAEANLYAFQSRGVQGGPYGPWDWMSAYHESDPRYPLLGIVKNICFVRCSTCAVFDIVCDGVVPGYYYPRVPATTLEGTKIVPDGLLTPGAHVQYFFREQKEEAPGPAGATVPDTSVVYPQLAEGSTDGHRWQQFGILPDRWKDPQYRHPVYGTLGRGPACLLVVDHNDRRGNERAWVSVADTIGTTAQEKWGAHNGWHARGDGDLNDPAANLRSDGGAGFTAIHGGQPGTTWDLYQVKAAESVSTQVASIGSRLANRSKSVLAPKASRQGPTLEVLNAYYTLILFLTGDLRFATLGPYRNHSQDDAGILMGWLARGDTTAPNRGIWVIGDGFVEDNVFPSNDPRRLELMSHYFRVSLVSPDYLQLAPNSDPEVDLVVFPEWQGKDPGAARVYGIRNRCRWQHDVLAPATPDLTTPASEYRKVGGGDGGPHYAGVFKDWSPRSPWMALVDGFDIENLTSRNDANTIGRSGYFFQIFTQVWARIWPVAGTPVVPLDVPSFGDAGPLPFLGGWRNNPLRSGMAAIRFALGRGDRVEVKVYDVAGRLVRTLADRHFEAGEHEIAWDGLDATSRKVPRGVYFTQVRFREQGFEGARKLTVLQ